jgi:hypothetical protein
VGEVAAKVCNDQEYRADTEAEITAGCGLAVDLSDAKSSIAFSFAKMGKPAEMSRKLTELQAFVLPAIASPKGKSFVAKAVADILQEYEKYHFYAGLLVDAAGPSGLLGETNVQRSAIRHLNELIAETREALAEKSAKLIEKEAEASEYLWHLKRIDASPRWRFGMWFTRLVKPTRAYFRYSGKDTH